MFTGLIEEKEKILNTPQGEAGSFSIAAGDILNDVELGDSIAVNGTCLTVTAFSKNHFEVDALAERPKNRDTRLSYAPFCLTNSKF